MQLKPEEISKVIRSQIKYYDNAIHQNETGTILMVGDGIARASGLINCMAGELLEFEDGSYGMAQNLTGIDTRGAAVYNGGINKNHAPLLAQSDKKGAKQWQH